MRSPTTSTTTTTTTAAPPAAAATTTTTAAAATTTTTAAAATTTTATTTTTAAQGGGPERDRGRGAGGASLPEARHPQQVLLLHGHAHVRPPAHHDRELPPAGQGPA